MGSFAEMVMAIREQEQAPDPQMAPMPVPYAGETTERLAGGTGLGGALGLGAGLGGLMSLLGGVGGVPGAGAGGGGGAVGGAGFSASPSGPDWRGADLTPNLVTRQGVTGVPPAVRLLLQAERALGVPGLSDAVVSDYRSAAQQYAMDPDQNGIGANGQPVAPVGKSFHQQGEAFDISSSFLAQNPRIRPFLERRGFTWDVPGEPWHAHYIGGGRVGGANPVSRMAPPQRSPQKPNAVKVPAFTSNRPQHRPQPVATPYLRQRR